jgi:hypothetical protein
VATATNDNGVGISAASAPTATVADPAVIATGGYQLKVTQGIDPGPQVVATFTDPGGAEAATADHYTATIDWGDRSAATAGIISFDAASGRYLVTGDHGYLQTGTFIITTTINHESATPVQRPARQQLAQNRPALLSLCRMQRRLLCFTRGSAATIFRSRT